ncbi:MAG: glycosyltransferase [Chitinophagaceae bacterium]|nr:glycosyltransferase [Chitinophagaceae bacterium]MBL0272355.1 glycosyltransferase [Chitinophagaceae bacterium]
MPPINWGEILFFLFIAVVIVQLYYYVFFFGRVAFYKSKPKTQSQQHPVSVIICARDEDENLARNLPGVLVQSYRSTYEVVTVNDNSMDDSKYILQELKKTFRSLNVVELTQEAVHISGKKYPLSVGIREAKHEVLLLTDADCVPASEHWIEKMQDGYDENIEIVLGYGAYHKRKGLLNKLIRFETFHTALQYLSYAMAGIPYMGVGRNLSYKKSLFFRVKGFSSINHIPSGDDDLFINKAATKHNTAVVIDPDAITRSIPKTTWGSWLRQKSRHYTTARFYKPKHKFLLGLYFATQFSFYPLLAAAIIFYDWRFVLPVFGIRFLLQGFVLYKSMKKMEEKDLWPWFIFLDMWMFFYYIIFAPALWRKPQKNW